jgi:hypothetical protein
MPMKRLIIFLCFLTAFVAAKGQKSCAQENYTTLTSLIQKNIPVNEDKYSGTKSEYFFIDIKITDKGDIADVDFMRKDNSANYRQIENVIAKIKKSWKPRKCSAERYIVPLFLLFSGSDAVNDKPFDLSDGEVWNDKLKSYFGREIVIQVFPTVK